MQLSLFDGGGLALPASVVAPAKIEVSCGIDDYAFLYTATEKGNNSGIRFAMTKEDACAWCESPLSKGVLHGTQWAYFWTSARNFIECHWGLKSARLSIKGIVDNGSWDERIASLGLHKIGVSEFKRVFGPLGIEVVT